MQYDTMKREIRDERKLVIGERKIIHLLVHSSGDERMISFADHQGTNE